MNKLNLDKRNRLVESRIKATNFLLGTYTYNERGLRVKAVRNALTSVQVVVPNGGESYYIGSMVPISWNGTGIGSGLVKLELLVDGVVAGTIAENLPGAQTTYQWQAGKTLTGWASPGSDLKVRVTAVVPSASSGTTYYFYDSGGKLLSEYDGTGACVKDYLYLGGKMIGEYVPSSNSYYYYGSDQINSTRLVTDGTGAVVHSAQYDPFGGLYKTWLDTYHPKPGFSGKEREFGSEMDYFGARYYGHKQYRFISVDPVIGKDEALTNPQLWNLYMYCNNNPVNSIDPDGKLAEILVENKIRREIKNKSGDAGVEQFNKAQAEGNVMAFAAGAVASAAITAGPTAFEIGLTFSLGQPETINKITQVFTGFNIPLPPDPNIQSYIGWVAALFTRDLNETIFNLKQTAANVEKGIKNVIDFTKNYCKSENYNFERGL